MMGDLSGRLLSALDNDRPDIVAGQLVVRSVRSVTVRPLRVGMVPL